MITESDDIAQALDLAAKRWPQHRRQRARLLADIAKDWAARHEDEVERRRQVIEEARTSLRGLWPPGWREELRNEWPE